MPLTLGVLTAGTVSSSTMFVGAAATSGSSGVTLTLPAFNAGDLILVGAFGTSGFVPQLPAGYTSLYGAMNSFFTINHGSRICYRIATASTPITVSSSQGSRICAAVYRNTPGVGAIATRFGNGNVSYPSLTMTGAPGWIVGMCSLYTGTTNSTFVPSGRTSRSVGNTTAIWDTNSDVSSYAGQSGSGASSYAMSFSIELQ